MNILSTDLIATSATSLTLGTITETIPEVWTETIDGEELTIYSFRKESRINFTYKDWQKGKSFRLIFTKASNTDIKDEKAEVFYLYLPKSSYVINLFNKPINPLDENSGACSITYTKINESTEKETRGMALKYYNSMINLKNKLLNGCYLWTQLNGFDYESW